MTQNAKKDAVQAEAEAEAEAVLGMGLICSQGPRVACPSLRLSAWSGLSFAFEEIINDLVFATVARESAGHGHGARRVQCRMKEVQGEEGGGGGGGSGEER